MTRDRLREAIDRRVTADELREALEGPITEEEREQVLALVRWFIRRYPTPQERLRYVDRAFARWQRAGAEDSHG